MKCPYCVSSIDRQALVCPQCKRDIALPKQLLIKISQLEKLLHVEQTKQQLKPETETRSVEIADTPVSMTKYEKYRKIFFDFLIFLITPLFLLLLSHLCIVIIYDTKILYLRIVTLILPIFFGFLLCRDQSRNIFSWFVCVVGLGWVAVAGMSAATSFVDGSPIWPQSMYVWRDLLEFAASISFSYLTGMLLGRLAFLKSNSPLPSQATHRHAEGESIDGSEERAPSASVQIVAKKISEFTTTLGAIVTTIVAIYTGLKGLF